MPQMPQILTNFVFSENCSQISPMFKIRHSKMFVVRHSCRFVVFPWLPKVLPPQTALVRWTSLSLQVKQGSDRRLNVVRSTKEWQKGPLRKYFSSNDMTTMSWRRCPDDDSPPKRYLKSNGLFWCAPVAFLYTPKFEVWVVKGSFGWARCHRSNW